MNILMAASEMAPLARSGSLGDSVAALAGELRALGHEVSVVLPFYRSIREGRLKTRKTGVRFQVPVGGGRYPCEIFECKAPNGVQVFLVSRDEFFDRSGVYGVDDRDYQDNAARFIFFTKCVVELARRADPSPSILHLNSWETALAPVFVRDQRLPFATVLTPHSLEYQGNFWSYDFALTNLPGDYFSAHGVEYYGSMNCLKGGLLFADAVVLPGERFVSAAQTPAYGCGLDVILREQQHKLCGIPSAVGLEDWDPRSDKTLAATFSAAKPGDRRKNRAPFLEAAGLDGGTPRAIMTCFTDAAQGGLDLLLGALDRLLVEDVRVAVLGDIPDDVRVDAEVARRKHKGRFVILEQPADTLARQALAASDFLLLPGPVEPSALWLRRGLLYGAIPVALHCGGLFQLARNFEPARDVGHAFIFRAPTPEGFLDACRRALRLLEATPQGEKIRARCLASDFSASASAQAHVALYERLTNRSAARAA